MNRLKLAAWICVAIAVPFFLQGQPPGPGFGKGKGPANARQAAPANLTGYWVPLITEDWLYRMVVPGKTKGAADVASVPVSPAGRTAANAWDPAKDEAAGDTCKSYGAVGILRLPGRLHIDWQDDNTLKLDFDAGTQTRLLHFGGVVPPSGDAGYQGYSLASWEGGGRGGPPTKGPPAARSVSLRAITTRMKPGYIRKNGVPYGANATLTEFFDVVNPTDGPPLLIVKAILDDPEFLTQPFITSTHFKKEPDGAKWNPTACSAR